MNREAGKSNLYYESQKEHMPYGEQSQVLIDDIDWNEDMSERVEELKKKWSIN